MSNEQTSSWANVAASRDKHRAAAPPPPSSSSSSVEQHVPSIDDAPGGSSSSSSSSAHFPLPRETVKQTSPSPSGVSDLLSQSGELIDKEEVNTLSPGERSYAFVTDFPSPQEAVRRDKSPSVPSSGVGDLLPNNTNGHAPKEKTTVPPHPARSFANVAGNKDFPDMPAPSIENNTVTKSLSDLPDVKEMLSSSPSVKVPPPPASQSFAKMAAKPAPVEEKPSMRRQAVEQQNRQAAGDESAPPLKTHDEFPTLQQASQMAENNVSVDQKERGMFAEISKLGDAVDAAAADDAPSSSGQQQDSMKASFASVAGSNLDKAPPSASPRPVPQKPVFDEETVMLENTRREIRRWRQKEPGEEITPEMKPMEERREEAAREQKVEEDGELELELRVQYFDQSNRGLITLWDTFRALRGLGYSCLTALPTSLLLHIRLSPLTSPHRFPFLYRSIPELLALPIYVDRVPAALSYGSPMLSGRRAHELVRKYGSDTASGGRALGFWAGIHGIRESENLRWWQLSSRVVHRLQWLLVYTMLQDPQTHLVRESTLASLPSTSS